MQATWCEFQLTRSLAVWPEGSSFAQKPHRKFLFYKWVTRGILSRFSEIICTIIPLKQKTEEATIIFLLF